jgi:hypothetical protein
VFCRMLRSGPELPTAPSATAEELRRQAEHARRLARHTTDQVTIDRLLELAIELETMASER